MTALPAVACLGLELEADDLTPLAVLQDFRDNKGIGNEGRTQANSVAVCHHENVMQLDASPRLALDGSDLKKASFANTILLSAGADYGVDGSVLLRDPIYRNGASPIVSNIRPLYASRKSSRKRWVEEKG